MKNMLNEVAVYQSAEVNRLEFKVNKILDEMDDKKVAELNDNKGGAEWASEGTHKVAEELNQVNDRLILLIAEVYRIKEKDTEQLHCNGSKMIQEKEAEMKEIEELKNRVTHIMDDNAKDAGTAHELNKIKARIDSMAGKWESQVENNIAENAEIKKELVQVKELIGNLM